VVRKSLRITVVDDYDGYDDHELHLRGKEVTWHVCMVKVFIVNSHPPAWQGTADSP